MPGDDLVAVCNFLGEGVDVTFEGGYFVEVRLLGGAFGLQGLLQLVAFISGGGEFGSGGGEFGVEGVGDDGDGFFEGNHLGELLRRRRRGISVLFAARDSTSRACCLPFLRRTGFRRSR